MRPGWRDHSPHPSTCRERWKPDNCTSGLLAIRRKQVVTWRFDTWLSVLCQGRVPWDDAAIVSKRGEMRRSWRKGKPEGRPGSLIRHVSGRARGQPPGSSRSCSKGKVHGAFDHGADENRGSHEAWLLGGPLLKVKQHPESHHDKRQFKHAPNLSEFALVPVPGPVGLVGPGPESFISH